jgi:mannan endo-1,4-beta-mannosidase
LSDYEWNDLLTSGSALNDRWNAQVDELAATLKELEKAGIPVLWTPYPESNAKSFWWAGRKGVHGSGALYRELFQRLVESDGVHNLIWVWEADAPDSGPNGAGSFNDYFPGLLYVDALEVKLHNLDDRFAGGGSLVSFAAGKPVGVELVGELPSPKALTGQRGWSWFLAAPPLASSADFVVRTDALRKIYADPLVVSLPAAQ